MALDFFGVQLEGSIEVFSEAVEDGDLGVAGIPFSKLKKKTFDLWLESNSDLAVPHALRTLSYVQDISVEIGMGLNSKVQLVLSPPWEEALILLNSPLIQWGIGRLNVSFGYSTGSRGVKGAGKQSFVFGGLIQKPDVKIGSDIVITINALGVGFALRLAEGSRAQNFEPGDTPATVVEKVLKLYPDINHKRLYEDFPENERKTHAFFKPIFQDTPTGPDQKVLERGPRSDWWFVWEVVRSYGLELLIIDNEFRILNSDTWRKKKVPSKNFRIRAGVDPAPQEGIPILPVLSLSSPTESVWLSSGVGRQVMKDIKEDKQDTTKVFTPQKLDSADKKVLEEEEGRKKKKKRKRLSKAEQSAKEALEIIEADIARVAKENSTWGTTKKGRLRAGPLASSANTPGNPESSLREHAKGALRRQNQLKGIHIDVQTIGLPDLRPGDIVKVDGFAVKGQKDGIFDGVYGVIEVMHRVGLGGFETTFKAISNFYPRLFQLGYQAAGDKTKDTPNKTGAAAGDDRVSVETTPQSDDE